MRRLALLAALMTVAAPAQAERLVTSLSNHQVRVTSSYTGDELVLFGTVEDTDPARLKNGYDIVATITGPRETMVTWRKDRVLGIWANVDSRLFENVPSYLAILATRPLDALTNRDTLRRQQLGLNNFLLPQRVGTDLADTVPDDPFRASFIRIKNQQGLYREEQNAVTFLSPTLFRADIPLPAQVPFGTYQVDVRLFADGMLLARDNSALEILKVGFEQFVANSARDHGLLYGLATAMMALLTGWFASVVFRKD